MTDQIKRMYDWLEVKKEELSHCHENGPHEPFERFISDIEYLLNAHEKAEIEFKHYADFAAKEDHKYHANQWLKDFGSKE